MPSHCACDSRTRVRRVRGPCSGPCNGPKRTHVHVHRLDKDEKLTPEELRVLKTVLRGIRKAHKEKVD